MVSQLTPWLVALPVLLVLIVGAVRHSMAPLRQLARDLEARAADERTPVSLDLPSELRPLVRAMNRLFDRVSVAIEHERRLTADAAHELRTPLAALRVQAEVAQLAEDPVARRHALGQLTLGIDRLSRVVAQLLDLARLDALGAPARVAGIDWARVVEQAVSECLPLAEERGSQIDCVWPAGAVQVLPLAGDETLIALLLRNLTDNALRYSQPGSLVEVVLAPQEVRVQDNGPGLPPAVLARLGERFYRPGGNDTRGSGLGLSIVRRVAGLHGLEVELANRPGGGFQVTLRLGSGPG
jgi:two-component system sensor histidine kinase QseC